MSLPPAVSPEVIIMTRAELRACEQAAYKRGVERGRGIGRSHRRIASRYVDSGRRS